MRAHALVAALVVVAGCQSTKTAAPSTPASKAKQTALRPESAGPACAALLDEAEPAKPPVRLAAIDLKLELDAWPSQGAPSDTLELTLPKPRSSEFQREPKKPAALFLLTVISSVELATRQPALASAAKEVQRRQEAAREAFRRGNRQRVVTEACRASQCGQLACLDGLEKGVKAAIDTAREQLDEAEQALVELAQPLKEQANEAGGVASLLVFDQALRAHEDELVRHDEILEAGGQVPPEPKLDLTDLKRAAMLPVTTEVGAAARIRLAGEVANAESNRLLAAVVSGGPSSLKARAAYTLADQTYPDPDCRTAVCDQQRKKSRELLESLGASKAEDTLQTAITDRLGFHACVEGRFADLLSIVEQRMSVASYWEPIQEGIDPAVYECLLSAFRQGFTVRGKLPRKRVVGLLATLLEDPRLSPRQRQAFLQRGHTLAPKDPRFVAMLVTESWSRMDVADAARYERELLRLLPTDPRRYQVREPRRYTAPTITGEAERRVELMQNLCGHQPLELRVQRNAEPRFKGAAPTPCHQRAATLYFAEAPAAMTVRVRSKEK